MNKSVKKSLLGAAIFCLSLGAVFYYYPPSYEIPALQAKEHGIGKLVEVNDKYVVIETFNEKHPRYSFKLAGVKNTKALRAKLSEYIGKPLYFMPEQGHLVDKGSVYLCYYHHVLNIELS